MISHMTSVLPRRAAAAAPAVRSSLSSVRMAAPSAVRLYSTPTQSEEAAKADAYHKHHDKEQMQKETVHAHTHERRPDKITASPNDAPTESEDVAHSHKDPHDIKTLQEKTAKKASSGHEH